MSVNQAPSSCLKKILLSAGVIVLILVCGLIGLAINQSIALAREKEQFPPPGSLLDVNGHRMHIYCLGSGSPTVVIDAGNGSFSVEWMAIQETLSQTTRTCTYDRSGYGWSETGSKPRDGAQAVIELHALLQSAGETGPYLLVGHSLGGVYVRMYALEHPGDVAGIMLIDTAYPLEVSPEYEMQMRSSIGFYQVMGLLTRSGILRILGPLGGESSMPETARKLSPEWQEMYLNMLLDPSQYDTAIAEMEALPATFEQANAMMDDQLFGDLPLVVITAGQMAASGSTPFDEARQPVPVERIDLQFALAGLSSQGQQIIIPDSGHLVHLDAPDAVVQAVQEMVEQIRATAQ